MQVGHAGRMHPIPSPMKVPRRHRAAIGAPLCLLLGLFAVPSQASIVPGSSIRPVSAQTRLADELSVGARLAARGESGAVGDRLEGRLEVIAAAPSLPVDADIVLVLDASGSMAGQPSAKLKDAARDMVTALDLAAHPDTRIGVVIFNTSARTHCQLSNDTGRVHGCINRIGANGGTAIDRGITEGLEVLRLGDPTRRPGLRQVMVVLSDGENNDGCAPVERAADAAKGTGLRLISVCVGGGCDSVCMQRIASGPGDYGDVPFFDDLHRYFQQVATQLRAEPAIAALEIQLELPAQLGYVPGSAKPAPVVGPDGLLRWEIDQLDRDGLSLDFALEILGPGSDPLRARIRFDLVDGSTLDTELEGWPDALPTPPPLRTPTASPTAPPRPSASPTPLAPPAWHRILLPQLSLFG